MKWDWWGVVVGTEVSGSESVVPHPPPPPFTGPETETEAQGLAFHSPASDFDAH